MEHATYAQLLFKCIVLGPFNVGTFLVLVLASHEKTKNVYFSVDEGSRWVITAIFRTHSEPEFISPSGRYTKHSNTHTSVLR